MVIQLYPCLFYDIIGCITVHDNATFLTHTVKIQLGSYKTVTMSVLLRQILIHSLVESISSVCIQTPCLTSYNFGIAKHNQQTFGRYL